MSHTTNVFIGEVRTNIDMKYRASDFFQDWWAEVTHGAKKW